MKTFRSNKKEQSVENAGMAFVKGGNKRNEFFTNTSSMYYNSVLTPFLQNLRYIYRWNRHEEYYLLVKSVL